jgi:transcription elongation regulator 1
MISMIRMTEDDIMWQLQEMEELSGEQMEQVELTEEQMEQDQTSNQEEQVPHQVVEEEKEKALTEQECIAQFNEMLKEKNISPFATYSTELPKLMTDPRFTSKFY